MIDHILKNKPNAGRAKGMKTNLENIRRFSVIIEMPQMRVLGFSCRPLGGVFVSVFIHQNGVTKKRHKA